MNNIASLDDAARREGLSDTTDFAESSTNGLAVVDAYALYAISTRHTPAATRLHGEIEAGRARVCVPATALAAACAFGDCLDSDCAREHVGDPSGMLRRLVGLTNVEIVALGPSDSIKVGVMYGVRARAGIVGEEVLASCQTLLLARQRRCGVLTTSRAAYCYAATLRDPGIEFHAV
jgi:hypothetical protein